MEVSTEDVVSCFSSSFAATCVHRAVGRAGPTLPLLGPRAAEDDVSPLPCSPTLSLWSPLEPRSGPGTLTRENRTAREFGGSYIHLFIYFLKKKTMLNVLYFLKLCCVQ